LHERVDGVGLFEDCGDLGGGGVVRGETILELLGVVLIVLEGAGDLHFAARSLHRRSFERAVEIAFELVAPVIDLVDQGLDVLVGQAFGPGLGERRHRPEGQGAREKCNPDERGDGARVTTGIHGFVPSCLARLPI
jgi:hypothetical protein